MAQTRRTLLPQFSIRTLLAATALMAVVSLVVSQALRGTAWVGGMAIGLVALAAAFAVYGGMFGLVWLFSEFVRSVRARSLARAARKSDLANKTIATAEKAMLSLLIGYSALCANACWAASGGLLTLPRLMPGEVDKTGGLTLSLSNVWADVSGYRPIVVEIKSTTGPVSADRVLTVRFRPKQQYTRYDSVAVTQTLEIPAGGTSAKAILSAPQFCPWGMFELDVVEDGQYIKQLSIGQSQSWASWSGSQKGDAASPVTLLLSGADTLSGNFIINSPPELLYVAPDSPNATIDPQISSSMANAGLVYAPTTPGGVTTSLLPSQLDQLPTRWIDYSGFDVMISSLERLQELAEKHTAQWSAIRNWLHNGGTLIVYSVGSHWEELDKLERLAAFPKDQPILPASELDPAKRGWSLPRVDQRSLPLQTGPSGIVVNPDGSVEQITDDNETDDSQPKPASDQAPNRPWQFVAPERAEFVTRQCGLGMLAAIRSTQSFKGSSFPWTWLYNSIGPERWQWHQRYGVSYYQPNEEFWNFLIPGVGLAPVLSFQVLITLFVLVIGPLNYYLLRRWGKLNLTVLTVPAGAIFITAALLAYAVISDGLSVRLRTRSITCLDQRTGESQSLARLSYYAGMAPGGGLTFSQDTMVIPLDAQPLAAYDGGPRRSVDWVPADRTNSRSPIVQNLTEGWLNSRTPTQLVTSRIHTTKSKLEVRPANNGKPLQVANHLGTSIKWLMFSDEMGDTFTTDAIADGESVVPTDNPSQKTFFDWLAANHPDRPDTQTNYGHGMFGLSRRVPYYQSAYARRTFYPNSGNMNVLPPTQSGGMMERLFGQLNLQARSGKLPARSYIAVVDSSPEVESGTTAAKEEASFHVIWGRW